MIERWTRLWEKVPELKPEALQPWHGYDWKDSHDQSHGEAIDLALIRDAAVRWLIKQQRYVALKSLLADVMFGDTRDLDAALLAACERECGNG